MRHNRQKAARKHLSFLSLNFSLPLPPTVIFDGTYLAEGVGANVPMRERIMGILKAGGINKAIWVVTRETVEELKKVRGGGAKRRLLNIVLC